MCFSAEASFIAAGVTGVAGAVALSRALVRSEWPLAAMPLFFAAQQAIEGFLWLALPVAADGAQAARWTHLFLMFALVFWPLYASISIWLMEPDAGRRRGMSIAVTCGVIVSAYFLWSLNANPQTALIEGGHIVYSGDPDMPPVFRLMYPIATCGAAALSSFRTIRLLALVLIVASLVSYFAYWHAFASVWCFFAAAASVLIVYQFEAARRAREAASV